jgi:hypothetical protein
MQISTGVHLIIQAHLIVVVVVVVDSLCAFQVSTGGGSGGGVSVIRMFSVDISIQNLEAARYCTVMRLEASCIIMTV